MDGEVRTVAAVGQRLGESALWQPERQRLLWIDLLEPELVLHEPATGRTERRPLAQEVPLGAIVPTPDPERVVLACRRGLVLLDVASGATTAFADPDAGRDAIAYNDAKTDRQGRLWTGTSDLTEAEPRGCLWCVMPDGSATLADAGFRVSNGPAFSPDGQTLYFADSFGARILAYDILADDPHPRGRRVFAQFGPEDGLPDGLTVDAEGALWAAHWAGACISRWSPAGERLATVPIPSFNVTSMAFGGPDLAILFVTSAWEGAGPEERARLPESGHLFAFDPGVRGIAEPHFAPTLS